jgi:hypothetical protein
VAVSSARAGEAANRGIELGREDAVAVVDQIIVSAVNPKRLA